MSVTTDSNYMSLCSVWTEAPYDCSTSTGKQHHAHIVT